MIEISRRPLAIRDSKVRLYIVRHRKVHIALTDPLINMLPPRELVSKRAIVAVNSDDVERNKITHCRETESRAPQLM